MHKITVRGGLVIERKKYLDSLIDKKENGLVKVITGVRRCGKSYLLFKIYKDYEVHFSMYFKIYNFL